MFVKVLRGHRYGGMYRKIGTVYDCPDKLSRVLIFAKKVEEYVEPPKKRGPGRPRKTEQKPEVETAKADYSTKVMIAED